MQCYNDAVKTYIKPSSVYLCLLLIHGSKARGLRMEGAAACQAFIAEWQIEVRWFTLTPFFALTGKNPEVAATRQLAANISTSAALMCKDTVASRIVTLHLWKILFVFLLGTGGRISVSVCLMAVPHNVPSVLRAPSARKHPSCFHSHGSPALLTLTSAFMWPGSKANLRAHNMFLNQWLGTDEALARIWRYHDLLLRCQHFPFRSAWDCRFLSANWNLSDRGDFIF